MASTYSHDALLRDWVWYREEELVVKANKRLAEIGQKLDRPAGGLVEKVYRRLSKRYTQKGPNRAKLIRRAHEYNQLPVGQRPFLSAEDEAEADELGLLDYDEGDEGDDSEEEEQPPAKKLRLTAPQNVSHFYKSDGLRAISEAMQNPEVQARKKELADSMADAHKKQGMSGNIKNTLAQLPPVELLVMQNPQDDADYPAPPSGKQDSPELAGALKASAKHAKMKHLERLALVRQNQGVGAPPERTLLQQQEEDTNYVDVSDYIPPFTEEENKDTNKAMVSYLREPRFDRRVLVDMFGGAGTDAQLLIRAFKHLDTLRGKASGLGDLFALMNKTRTKKAAAFSKQNVDENDLSKVREQEMELAVTFSSAQKLLRQEKPLLAGSQRQSSVTLYWLMQYMLGDKRSPIVHSDITAVHAAVAWWTVKHWMPLKTETARAKHINHMFTHLKPLFEAVSLSYKRETSAYTDTAKAIQLEKVSKGKFAPFPKLSPDHTKITLGEGLTAKGETVYKYYEFSTPNPEKKQLAARIHEMNLMTQNMMPIDFQYNDVVAAKNRWWQSDNWIHKVLLVQLATGARFIEVLAVSDFYGPGDLPDREDAIPPHHIVIHKVAKDKNNRGKYVHQKYNDPDAPMPSGDVPDEAIDDGYIGRFLPPKPTLFIPPALVRFYVYKVIRPYVARASRERALADGRDPNVAPTNAELTGWFNKIGVSEARLAFPAQNKEDESPIRGTHTLRKIYANLSYDLYSEKSVTKNAWIQRVLGHEPTSVTTSLSYTGLNVTQATKELETPEMTQKFELLQSEVHDALSRITNLLEGKTDGVMIAPTRRPSFINIDGFKVRRWEKRRDTPEERKKRFDAHIEEMVNVGIRPSWTNLRLIGMSQQLISLHKVNADSKKQHKEKMKKYLKGG